MTATATDTATAAVAAIIVTTYNAIATVTIVVIFAVIRSSLQPHHSQTIYRMCPHSLCRTGKPSRSISSPWVLNFLKRPDLACHAACFMFCYCVHLMISWCCICIHSLFPQEILQKNPDLPQECRNRSLVTWMSLTRFETMLHTHTHTDTHSQDFLVEAATTNPEIVRAQQHLPQGTNASQLMTSKKSV